VSGLNKILMTGADREDSATRSLQLGSKTADHESQFITDRGKF
jgi:hypothetical protein